MIMNILDVRKVRLENSFSNNYHILNKKKGAKNDKTNR